MRYYRLVFVAAAAVAWPAVAQQPTAGLQPGSPVIVRLTTQPLARAAAAPQLPTPPRLATPVRLTGTDRTDAQHAELLAAIDRLTSAMATSHAGSQIVSGELVCGQELLQQVQIQPQLQTQTVERPLPVQVQMAAPSMQALQVPVTPPQWSVTPQFQQSAPIIDGNRNMDYAEPRIYYIEGKPVIGIDPEPRPGVFHQLMRWLHGR